MKHLWILACVMLLLTACGKDNDGPAKPKTAKRTVVVYMAGETNLSSYTQDDIDEMIEGAKTLSDDYRLVVFVDRASTEEKPFIMRISNNPKQPVDTLYKYATDFYSSDADCMSEVLQRAQALCPAESYGLVLWGHANGWIIERDSVSSETKAAPRRAYGVDNGRNSENMDGKWLNLPSMRRALEGVGPKWKFIFADCCNMMNVETAYELRNATEYLIASPAEITGVGAPYDVIVKDLFIDNDQTMYQSLCNDYYAQTDVVGGHLPISVVKTANMPALSAATKAILAQIKAYLQTEGCTDGVIYYYAYDKWQEREKIMYDMNDMVSRALADEPATYQSWRNVLDQTVVYSKMSTKWLANCVPIDGENNFSDFIVTNERFGGISMFFPLEKYDYTAPHLYNEAIAQLGWFYAVGWPTVGWPF